MSALLALAIGAGLAVGAVLKAALGDMARQEATTRLSQLPAVVIRLAARRVPRAARADLTAEWQGELDHIVKRTGGLPLTRLVRGIYYALSMLPVAKTSAVSSRPSATMWRPPLVLSRRIGDWPPRSSDPTRRECGC